MSQGCDIWCCDQDGLSSPHSVTATTQCPQQSFVNNLVSEGRYLAIDVAGQQQCWTLQLGTKKTSSAFLFQIQHSLSFRTSCSCSASAVVRVRSARRACFAADYTKVRNLLSVARSIEELFAFMQFSSSQAVRVCHSQVQIWKGFVNPCTMCTHMFVVRVRSARRACFDADYTKVRNLLSVARSIEELFAFMQFSSSQAVRVCHSQVQIWKGFVNPCTMCTHMSRKQGLGPLYGAF